MKTAWKWLGVVVCLVLFLAASPARAAEPTAVTPIDHIIIVTQENHSFDNYFGTYPTANGTLLNAITEQLPPVNGIPRSVCLPYDGRCVSPSPTNSSSPTNPVEGQLVYEADYQNNGTGFPSNSGVQSMVYFDYHTIPAYWDYAEEYGLADNYFAPVLTQSNANRLIMLAGDSPVSADDGPPPYMPYNESVMAQLDGAGLSWGYFDYITPDASKSGAHPLNYFSGMTPQAMSSVQDLSSLYKDLASGSGLPNVSYVNSLSNKTFDEHPPNNPKVGEEWVVSVVNRVMNSAYWNSTAIFITWDEGGGFYDHVIPPLEFTIDHGFSSALQGFGQRIPLLVISPYSREAYVSNTLMSHLSLIHFIEYNWNLPALNANVANSNLPLGFFDFSQPPRAPIVLGSSGAYSMLTYPIPLQLPLSISSTQTSTLGSKGATGGGAFSPSLVDYELALIVACVCGVFLMARRLRAGPNAAAGEDPTRRTGANG